MGLVEYVARGQQRQGRLQLNEMECGKEYRFAKCELASEGAFTFNGLADCHAVIAAWLMPEEALGAGRQRAKEERVV
jgi:hypothetical protein